MSTLIIHQQRLADVFRRNAPNVPLLGQNQEFIQALAEASLFAPTDKPILIVGETGTGKDVVAKAIHQNSLRKANGFFPLNCAAVPTELLESTLFGHRKGAFTGAIANKKGVFEVAQDGTLFLDEVGEMPPDCQVKLLRAVEDGDILPVGAEEPQEFHPRILCSVNGLQGKLESGQLRPELFHRLSVGVVNLPPLKERKDDIPLLCKYFLKQENSQLLFSQEALSILEEHIWPGNIRELKNVVERAVVLAMFEDVVLPKHIRLTPATGVQSDTPDTASTVEDALGFLVEQMRRDPELTINTVRDRLIVKTVEACGDNRRQAMRVLGVRSINTILDRVGLKPKEGS